LVFVQLNEIHPAPVSVAPYEFVLNGVELSPPQSTSTAPLLIPPWSSQLTTTFPTSFQIPPELQAQPERLSVVPAETFIVLETGLTLYKNQLPKTARVIAITMVVRVLNENMVFCFMVLQQKRRFSFM